MRKNILLASTLAFLGCGNRDFNRPDLLNEPRILAMQAEPPQPTVGTSTTLRALVYQPPVTTDGGACPNANAAPTYAWSWCPLPYVLDANNNYTCPIDTTGMNQLLAALGAGQAPPVDPDLLGTDETATFTNPFPAPLLYSLCRGDIGLFSAAGAATSRPDSGQSSLFQCDRPSGENTQTPLAQTDPIGFQIAVKLVVTPSCPSLLPAGFSPLVALFTVHLPTKDALPGNLNPVMNGIFVTSPLPNGIVPSYDAAPIPQDDAAALDSATTDDDGGTSLADGAAGTAGPAEVDAGVSSTSVTGWELDDRGSVPILRNQHVSIQLDVPSTSSEPMSQPWMLDDVYDSNGNLLGTLQFERLNFAWFIEAGDLGSDGQGGRRTGYLPDISDPAGAGPDGGLDTTLFERALSNTWTLPLSTDYPPKTSRIIVVVRDSRGGVAWTSGVATLQDKP
jgi:hypothetical protein